MPDLEAGRGTTYLVARGGLGRCEGMRPEGSQCVAQALRRLHLALGNASCSVLQNLPLSHEAAMGQAGPGPQGRG